MCGELCVPNRLVQLMTLPQMSRCVVFSENDQLHQLLFPKATHAAAYAAKLIQLVYLHLSRFDFALVSLWSHFGLTLI